jgi:hypothetical protein
MLMNVSQLETVPPRTAPTRRRVWTHCAWTAMLLMWLACVLAGLLLLWRYEATPGPAHKTDVRWPAASSIVLSQELPTLLIFAHPHCPCTRATIAELGELMTHNQGRVDARVYFFQPMDQPRDWSQTDLYQAAAAIPGVTVEFDPDNVEANRFGAKTSGYALLFDRGGRLLFSGGITAARGHVGDNEGRDAIETLLAGGRPEAENTLVFGCPLSDPDESSKRSPAR